MNDAAQPSADVTPEQVEALLAHIDRRGHYMRGRNAPHAHTLADPRARELMRQYFADELTEPWYEVAEQLEALGLDEQTTRALQAWVRSLRRTRVVWADQMPEAEHGTVTARVREQLAVRFGTPAPQRTMLGQITAVMRHDTRDRLPRLRVPTLVVRPGKDRLVDSKRNDDLARLIDGASLVRLDHAGHGITFQCADALNAMLLSHFAAAEGHTAGPAASTVSH